MIEDITGGILRAVLYVIFEFLFSTVCYFIGWPICKALTFGRYPEKFQKPYFEYSRTQAGWPCALVGLLSLIALFFLIYKLGFIGNG